jgi:hypothetical protein
MDNKTLIYGVYYRDWIFINDAAGRLKDDFVLIIFLWMLVCFIAGWIVTHLPGGKNSKK